MSVYFPKSSWRVANPHRGDRMAAVMRTLAIIGTLTLLSVVSLRGQAGWGRNYGRSMVITQQGIAATSQTLASSAAAEILGEKRRDHRVDAAIAANAVLAVVEPG